MTATGAHISEMMGQVKKLFRQTALLLKTADDYMRNDGWALRTNQCVSVQTIPDAATYWFPKVAFRLYKHDQYPHILLFVSVIFDDREERGKVSEPLATAGWHDYGKGREVGASYEYDLMTWHIDMPARTDDGRPVTVDPGKEWPKDNKYRIQKTTTLALPLVQITNGDELNARIIQPVLKALSEGLK